MTKDEAKAWLHRFLDTPDELKRTCENRHRECSIDDGGPCSDRAAWDASDRSDEIVGCETCGGQRQVDISPPDPALPAQWIPCPECREFKRLLPAQRLAAGKARQEMGDDEGGC